MTYTLSLYWRRKKFYLHRSHMFASFSIRSSRWILFFKSYNRIFFLIWPNALKWKEYRLMNHTDSPLYMKAEVGTASSNENSSSKHVSFCLWWLLTKSIFCPLDYKRRGEQKKKKTKRTIPKKEFPKKTKSLEGRLRTECRQNQGLLQNLQAR